MQKITSLLFKLYPGCLWNWSVLALNALSANKNRLGLEIGLFIQHSKWKHSVDWTVHLSALILFRNIFSIACIYELAKNCIPGLYNNNNVSLLFHPCQQKLSHKQKYPQYTVQMEASSFTMHSVASWPTFHHIRMPDVFAVVGRESEVNFLEFSLNLNTNFP